MKAAAGRFVPADEDFDLPPLGECPDVPCRRAVVYIAGPMTGLPEFNYPAFHAKAAELRAQGYEVRSPAEQTTGTTDRPWEFYMRLALRLLLDADEIYMLPGWSNSSGACLEYHIANRLGMRVSGAAE